MQTKEIPAPLVKWAGGKRQLLGEIDVRRPQTFGRYFEPFFGGGAVFFHLQPGHAYINDLNPALINLYTTVRDSCEEFLNELATLDAGIAPTKEETKEYYYTQRSRYNELLASEIYDVETAALLVFLNKHCFNGLYRVNAKGAFNVPYNTSLRPSFDEKNVHSVAQSLKNATITCDDFEPAVQDARPGDFIFLDSPYAPLNDTSFEAYTKEGFLESDHRRLAQLFYELDQHGCKLMLTNHDTPLIRELYSNYKIDVVDVRRSINSNAAKRTGTEVIVTNY